MSSTTFYIEYHNRNSEAPRQHEMTGVINHGKELDDVRQTKGVDDSATSSSLSDASITRAYPKLLHARITRTNTTTGQAVANERLEGVISIYTQASSNVSDIKVH
ncbi:hypothetical protein CPB85DRAFT_1260995 [Mucidula mucida]|nr:hypothetical protein CPB85DRAFT_1260995 [Mucidula mucida]